MLSDEQRRRVEQALDWSEYGNKMDLVMRMSSAYEFHQYALNYNVNDGALPLFFIVKNPECDLGTALFIYWLHEDFLNSGIDDKDEEIDENEHNWNQLKLVKLIEERVGSNMFKNKNIRFSPMEFLQWTETQLQRNKKYWGDEWPFPEYMLETSPGEDVIQIHFL